MESDSTGQIIIFFCLLVFSAFFSASETALMSLSKIRIKQMVAENIRGANIIEKLIQNPGKLLSSILIGNNIVNIGASALATSLCIKYFENKGVGIATGIVTLMVLVFGEITPKAMASRYAEWIALKVCNIVYMLTVLLYPASIIFMTIPNLIIKILGGNTISKSFITEAELRTMVNISHEEGGLEIKEKEMIHNVFEFNDTLVKDVMTQRTDIIAVEKKISISEIIKIFKQEQFSRIPVYEDSIDNIVGIIHVKDLFFYGEDKELLIENYIREPFRTYEYKKIDDLFADMRKNRVPIAIVLDEYGGTAGLITIEDLVEEIVGEIEDEYDDLCDDILLVKEDEYIIDGSAKIEFVNEMIGTNIESVEFDTIGGFIIGQIDKLPICGDEVEYQNVKFIIKEVEKHRLKKLIVLT